MKISDKPHININTVSHKDYGKKQLTDAIDKTLTKSSHNPVNLPDDKSEIK